MSETRPFSSRRQHYVCYRFRDKKKTVRKTRVSLPFQTQYQPITKWHACGAVQFAAGGAEERSIACLTPNTTSSSPRSLETMNLGCAFRTSHGSCKEGKIAAVPYPDDLGSETIFHAAADHSWRVQPLCISYPRGSACPRDDSICVEDEWIVGNEGRGIPVKLDATLRYRRGTVGGVE